MTGSVTVIGIIQARMGSSRLPGKLLAPVAGRPLLEVLVERVRSASVAEWWLATTNGPDDEITDRWGEALGLGVLRGDRDDVLSRFVAVIREREPTWVVRLTADNPFVDGGIVDRLVDAVTDDPGVDHLAEPAPRSLPLGYVPEIARASALLELAGGELPPHDRAHVTSALRSEGRSRGITLPAWPARPGWRWTVDTPDDLRMADTAFRAFGGAWSTIDYPTMVAVLDEQPSITDLNRDVPQKQEEEG